MAAIPLPSTHRALTVDSTSKASVKTQALPKLRDDYILVRTYSVALNPTDWKHLHGSPNPGCLLGCDYAGTVVSVGSKVTKPFKAGDSIAGFAHGCNFVEKEDGAFGEYIVVKGDVQMILPDRMSFQEASTLGVAFITIGQALVQSLKLPTPDKPSSDGTSLLVYGGSSAMGTFAIQIAKLSGLKVVTTCSERNFDLVKKLGADEAFDYSDPEVGQKINKATGNQLQYAFDCIVSESSVAICYAALSTASPAHYTSLLGKKTGPREIAYSGATMAYTCVGEAFKMGSNDFPAIPEDFEFAKQWASTVQGLLAEGKITAHPQDVREGGLDKIVEGLEDLRTGKVSGKKIVYNLA
ncbi:MAG: hypothetical protein M1814_003282 [Vezdaea aestivalis]|nr:MAG: hypothetical protein M1814_003282 [Vezdaea aestivalis]